LRSGPKNEIRGGKQIADNTRGFKLLEEKKKSQKVGYRPKNVTTLAWREKDA